MRASRLASAAATSIRGLRASIRASHGSLVLPRRTALLTTAMAPRMNSRRRSRWPIFDTLPSRVLPPVPCWRGTRPSQAGKSRLRRKPSSGGASACKAIAHTGPIPGMLISRDVSSLRRASARICFSIAATRASRPAICSSMSRPSVRASSGRPELASSIARARTATCAGPRGATIPNSARWPRNALIVCVRWRTAWSRQRNNMPRACCSALLTATQRIVGRDAASQIASASTASFFWRFTYGFTDTGGTRRTSWPNAPISRPQ